MVCWLLVVRCYEQKGWYRFSVPALGKGTKLQLYMDVFNALNRVNHGLFVIHQQLTSSGGVFVRNPGAELPVDSLPGQIVSAQRTTSTGRWA